jgi:hypothetical protein
MTNWGRREFDIEDSFGRKFWLKVLGVCAAAALVAGLAGCASTPDPDRCASLKAAADRACAHGQVSNECTALKLAYSVAGCGTYTPPVPDVCPVTCPEGQECTDPAKGCVPKPVEPPPVDPPPCTPDITIITDPAVYGEWSNKPQQCGTRSVSVTRHTTNSCTGETKHETSVATESKNCNDIAGGFPQGVPDEDQQPLVNAASTLHDVINQAMKERTGCEVGSRCILNETPQQWFDRVCVTLRSKGYSCGQAEIGESDEINARKDADPGCDWQAWHVAFYGTPTTVVWAKPGVACTPGECSAGVGAYRGTWRLKPEYCEDAPPPPPVADACPYAPCPTREWTAETLPDGWGEGEIGKPAYQINAHRHTMGNADSTPVVIRQEPFCRSIGMSPYADGQPRASCPVRPDGHSERDEVEAWLLYGGPVRDSRNGQDCRPNNTDNPYAFLAGTGNCRMCNTPKTACSEWF